MRAKKKKRREDKKLKVRVNDIKRKEMGVRCTSYNSSRVFSTVIPEFTIGDKVTNRPVTVGEKLKSTREDWIIDEMDNRKAKCTNVHNPKMKKEWELDLLEHKTASVGDMNRDYCMKTLERDLLKRILQRKEGVWEKKKTKLESTIQHLKTKVDALSDENDKMKASLEKCRGRQRELLSRVREKSNSLKEFKDELDDAHSILKSQMKV